jgi:nucleotide-binding universal stress UspA family protein
MKKILVPTDFSEQSYFAFETAVSIARKAGASLHLHHVIEIPDYPEITDITAYRLLGTTNVLQSIEERLRDLADSDLCYDLQLTWSIDYDTPYEKITAKALEEKIDLIVMGSHGRKGTEKTILGSTTEKVIRHAPCLVMSIREPIACFSPSDIVFASDFSGESATGIHRILEFAAFYGSTLHLVKITTRQHFETTGVSRQLMEKFAEKHGLTAYSINSYNDYTEEEGILNSARDLNASLICVATHVRSGLAHFIRGSIAEHVSEHAPCPVLVYSINPGKSD